MQSLTLSGTAMLIYGRHPSLCPTRSTEHRCGEEHEVLGCILRTVLTRVQHLSFMFLVGPGFLPRHSHVTILHGNTVIVRACNQTDFKEVVLELRTACELPQDVTFQFVLDTDLENSAEKEEDVSRILYV